MKSNVKWIVFFGALCAVCAAFSAYRYFAAPAGDWAVVKVDGEVVRRVDLGSDEPIEFDIETQYGFNRIRVADGGICVIDADCPDRLCVKQGRAISGGVPIVCLPHRLTIEVGGGDTDAATGGF